MNAARCGGRRWSLVLLAAAVVIGACHDGHAVSVSPGSAADASSPDRLCPKLAETFYSRDELLVFFAPGSSASAVSAVTDRLDQSPLVATVSRLGATATRAAFRELFANQPGVLGSVDAERLPEAVVAAIPPPDRSRQLDLLDELAGADGVLQLVPASIRGQAIATVLLFPWRLPVPVTWPALQEAFTLRGVTTSRARAAWAAVLGELTSLDGRELARPLAALVAAHQLLLTRLGTSTQGTLVGQGGMFSDATWDRLRGDAVRVAAAATGTCGITLSG